MTQIRIRKGRNCAKEIFPLRICVICGQSLLALPLIPANVNNLHIFGVGDTRNPDADIPINLKPASGSPNGFEIYGSNIAIRNINFGSGFGHGVLIKPEASNVTLENVRVDSSSNAGILIGGDGLCARGTTVMNAPLGYNIAPDAGARSSSALRPLKTTTATGSSSITAARGRRAPPS